MRIRDQISFVVPVVAALSWCGALVPVAQADDSVVPINEVFEPSGTFDPKTFLKVAVVQWAPQSPSPIGVDPARAEQVKAANRAVAARYVQEAVSHGARWVVLPEFAVVGYPDIPDLPDDDDNFRSREDIAPYVERIPGATSDFFAELARRYEITISVGIAEVDPVTDNYHNSVAVITPGGAIAATHRKVHLFELEEHFLVPGDGATVFESPIGKVGLTVCSDIYYEPILSVYAAQKVSVVMLSTSWAQYNTGWSHFQAASRRVGSAVVAANHNFFPDSGVIDSAGRDQSHIRQTTGIAYGYLPYVQ